MNFATHTGAYNLSGSFDLGSSPVCSVNRFMWLRGALVRWCVVGRVCDMSGCGSLTVESVASAAGVAAWLVASNDGAVAWWVASNDGVAAWLVASTDGAVAWWVASNDGVAAWLVASNDGVAAWLVASNDGVAAWLVASNDGLAVSAFKAARACRSSDLIE